jgi:hypothetical protein
MARVNAPPSIVAAARADDPRLAQFAIAHFRCSGVITFAQGRHFERRPVFARVTLEHLLFTYLAMIDTAPVSSE